MFKIKNEDSKARHGFLETNHGKIETPFFMPVATKGATKYITKNELKEMKYDCFISNAFLLWLFPGLEQIEKAGGLHKYIGWDKGIFTDSGGFQVLDPNLMISINDSHVTFRNPYSLESTKLSPEKLIEIQNSLSSDIAMVLDDVPRLNQTQERYVEATRRTIEWAKRCKQAHNNDKQLLFGIIQGGLDKELREKCTKKICEIDFDGIALGGLAIGEKIEDMMRIVTTCEPLIPKEKIRYLMGLGSPSDLLKCIGEGMDCFDSNFPTRMARHGTAFTSNGNLDLKKSNLKNDFGPLDSECDCFVCRNHTRAYLWSLLKLKEPTGLKKISYHNLHFISKLIQKTRQAIKENEFKSFSSNFIKNYAKRLN